MWRGAGRRSWCFCTGSRVWEWISQTEHRQKQLRNEPEGLHYVEWPLALIRLIPPASLFLSIFSFCSLVWGVSGSPSCSPQPLFLKTPLLVLQSHLCGKSSEAEKYYTDGWNIFKPQPLRHPNGRRETEARLSEGFLITCVCVRVFRSDRRVHPSVCLSECLLCDGNCRHTDAVWWTACFGCFYVSLKASGHAVHAHVWFKYGMFERQSYLSIRYYWHQNFWDASWYTARY